MPDTPLLQTPAYTTGMGIDERTGLALPKTPAYISGMPAASSAPPLPASPAATTPRASTTPGSINPIATPQAPDPYTANQATPQAASAVGYTPQTFTVNDPSTVQGQVKGIIQDDSPLMQQARTRANQDYQSRGLLDSSMAIGAGQQAVLNAALPIAQQDANTYNQAMTNTANAKNAALNFGAAATNTASQQNAQLGTNVSLANADSANKALQDAFQAKTSYGLAGLDTNTKIALANLDTGTKIQLTQLENENRSFLQANQSAASMFNQVATTIANISQNSTMSQAAKDDAVATQMNILREGLRQQGAVAGLDLGSYFQPVVGTPVPPRASGTYTAIPQGGYRLSNGDVFDRYGQLLSHDGPLNQPSSNTTAGTPGSTGSIPTGTVSPPGTSPGVPTGTVAPPSALTAQQRNNYYRNLSGGRSL